nr:hypothetical protein [uncultured Dethiosulfovibrio sp.]
MLSDSPIKVIYECDGSTTVWGFPEGVIFSADQVRVIVTNEEGVETQLRAGYTVDLVSKKVTYPLTGSPLPTGYRLTVKREVPYRQEVDGTRRLTSLRVITEQLDTMVMQIQQLAEATDRSVRVGISDQETDVGAVVGKLQNIDRNVESASASAGFASRSADAAASDALAASESKETTQVLEKLAAVSKNDAVVASQGSAQSASTAEYWATNAINAGIVPAWSTTGTYQYPDTVAYVDGHTYRCISEAPVSGEIPGTSLNWTRLTALSVLPTDDQIIDGGLFNETVVDVIDGGAF